MKRAATALLLLVATARADWHPGFAVDLATNGMELAVLTNLLAAVNERCEATFAGLEVVGQVTNRTYQVAPIAILNTWTDYDYSNLTSTVEAGVTNWAPASTNMVATNRVTALVPWEVGNAIMDRILSLAPYYVCSTCDVDASVLASNGVPMWSASNLLAYVGSTNTFGPQLPRQAERDTTFALGQLVVERTRRYKFASDTLPAITGEYSRTAYSEWTGPGTIWSNELFWRIGSSTSSPASYGDGRNRMPPLGRWHDGAFPYTNFVGRLSQTTNVDAFARFVDQGQMLGDYVDLNRTAMHGEILLFTNLPRLVAVCDTTNSMAGVEVRIEGSGGVLSNGVYQWQPGQKETVTLTGLTGYCTRLWHDVTNLVLLGDVPANLQAVRMETYGRHYMAGTPARQVYREALATAYRCLREMAETAPQPLFWSDVTISTSRAVTVGSPIDCAEAGSGSTNYRTLGVLAGFQRSSSTYEGQFMVDQAGTWLAADYLDVLTHDESHIGQDAAVVTERLGITDARRWRAVDECIATNCPPVGWRTEPGSVVGSFVTNYGTVAYFAPVAFPSLLPNRPEPIDVGDVPDVRVPECMDNYIEGGNYFDTLTGSASLTRYYERNAITIRWAFDHPAR